MQKMQQKRPIPTPESIDDHFSTTLSIPVDCYQFCRDQGARFSYVTYTRLLHCNLQDGEAQFPLLCYQNPDEASGNPLGIGQGEIR